MEGKHTGQLEAAAETPEQRPMAGGSPQESAFAFVQFFTVYYWAKLSDRIGRKPVILCGLLGVAFSIASL